MVRKILSQLVSKLREGLAWGLAYSPPSRLTVLLEPLAADGPTPRLSSPPSSEVVTPAETDSSDDEPSAVALVVSRFCDGVAMLLFFLWHCEIRLHEELHAWKRALHAGYVGWGL